MQTAAQNPAAVDNKTVATLLGQAAALLIDQGANPFRANAYRRAAANIAHLDRSVREIFQAEGREGLIALPGIGEGIASAIAEILVTGHWNQLERLRGTIDPVATLRRIPGIGAQLAKRIHDTLHVDTLEALESACRQGRLAAVPGVGARRAAGIGAAIGSLLGQRGIVRKARESAARGTRAPVALLLDVDREYREKAQAGELTRIAPRRFNPGAQAWLPIMHTNRGSWHITALYSNTARAHELNKTRDWVVIYAYDASHAEQQHTVVTETHGKLRGRRVVRGREPQCAELYRHQAAGAPRMACVASPGA